MIIASLENSSRIEPLHPSFKKVFDYLRSTDFTTLEEGKFPIDERIVLSIATIMGKERCEAPLETHHKYIDIQMPINTTETYGWKPLSELTALSVPYDIDKDITFFDDCPSVFVPVDPGNFIIFFPEDAHAPGIGNVPIKKIVVKIKL
ncbi:MAG: YhcH/YjgK/YiaL family protein [Bacteroidales bacterium]|nr:YhcH/YjgK/YiaL family protein [Bacteroidales bacterium]